MPDRHTIPPALRLFLPVLILPLLGGVVGATTRPGVTGWYQSLIKPDFNPPDWVFGATWTILYIMMGFALGLLWRHAAQVPRWIFVLFLAQIVVNLGWSYAFFQFHWLWVSTVWVAVLAGMVGWLISGLRRVMPVAALLLLPYLGWLGFALTLSLCIARLNG